MFRPRKYFCSGKFVSMSNDNSNPDSYWLSWWWKCYSVSRGGMNEKNHCVSSSWIDVGKGHPPWSFPVKLPAGRNILQQKAYPLYKCLTAVTNTRIKRMVFSWYWIIHYWRNLYYIVVIAMKIVSIAELFNFILLEDKTRIIGMVADHKCEPCLFSVELQSKHIFTVI